MNHIQTYHNIEYLFDKISFVNGEQILLKFIHKYSKFFLGNKNHFQDFKENKITLLGLWSNLKFDILGNLRHHHGIPPGDLPCHPVNYVPLDNIIIQEIVDNLIHIVYP
jgi:hypothetical protein